MKKDEAPPARARRMRAWLLCVALGLALLALDQRAQAQGQVVPPNGTLSEDVVDLSVQGAGGAVQWKRTFNGTGWRFNRHWDGISASYKPVMTQNTGGGSPSAGSEPAVCWIWVDEDWQPGDGVAGLTPVAPGGPTALPADSYLPLNRGYNQTATPLDQNISTGFASACGGIGGNITGASSEVFEGWRRQSTLYVGAGGTYIFKNRYVLKKQPVQKLPAWTGEPAGGSVSLAALQAVASGWRWSDRAGDWSEYDGEGRISRYGDRNDNAVWLQRNAGGQIVRIIDGAAGAASGQVLITLHYDTSGYLVQARDWPQATSSLEPPQRVVTYSYDSLGRMTAVADVRGFATVHAYDSKARLVSTTDPRGGVTTLAYESEGNAVIRMSTADGAVSDYASSWDDTRKLFYSKVQGPATSAGRRVEDYSHDRAGDLVRYEVNGRSELEIKRDPIARTEIQTNARGFATVYTKNEFEQVTQVTHPDGAKTATSYEARWLNPVEETDELGVKTRYEYDGRGNLTRKVQAAATPEERATEYQLDSAGRPMRITRKGRTETGGTVTPDAAWQISYDAAGQISQTIDPEGNQRSYVFSRLGQLAKYTDPLGRSSSYEVDARGHLVKATDALGRVRTYTYDANGSLAGALDARGKATQLAYDAMNRNTEVTNPVGGRSRKSYSAQGLPISQTDEDGRTSTAEFDNFLRLSQQIDALGNTTSLSYQVADGSSAGGLGSLYEPTETRYPTFTERRKYDQRERATSQTLLNPGALGTEGLVSASAYDPRGQLASDTDANGKTRYHAYDALGQLSETTDSLGNKTKAQYDARGNLIQVTDARGNVNRFEFDRNDRLTREVLPLGQGTRYSYDEVGKLKEYTDPNGHRTAYSFDAANRLVQTRQYGAGNVLRRTTSLAWDAGDNLTAWSDVDASRPAGQQTSSAVLTYDDAGRKTGEAVSYPNPQGGASATLGYSYQYSPAGKKTQLTWADGTAIGYGYSAHGELETVTIPGEGSLSVSQFKWTAPASVTLPGGTVQERTLDGLLNLEALKVKTPGQQTVLSVSNTYGKVQELKTSSRTDAANGQSSTRTSAFQYDGETRLVQASLDSGGLFGSATENFTLDAVGNRIAHSQVSGAWTYDANNRLTQRGTGANATSYGYDEAGNLTRKTGPGGKATEYGYDTQSRLVEIKDASGGQSNLIARYGYDPLDRRLWKEQYRDRDGNALASPKRTYYLYGDEGLIAESVQDIVLDGAGSVTASAAPAITTQYGPRPDAEFTSDMLFIKTRSSNGQDLFAYYHQDHLGTPIQATDKAGRLVWAASYNAFGKAGITTPAPAADKPVIASNLRLPGQYEDAESGLHYNWRRYYDPETGRYITQDPIGLDGGINQYRYASADPLNLTDPTGEIVPLVAAAAAFGECMAMCALTTAAENAVSGQCNNWGATAKDCAIGCAAGMGAGFLASKAFGWAKKGWQAFKNRPCALSFPGDTLVHIKPRAGQAQDARQGKADLLPISALKVGDEVLAFSEWQAQGGQAGGDARLSYEKVTDLFTSRKPQTLVHLTLDNGRTITATQNHPFRTTEGWRDAILLKKGGRLLLKGDGEADSARNQALAHKASVQTAIETGAQGKERVAVIASVRLEEKILPVFNLEVANAHTFFVGVDGVLVHNACDYSKIKSPASIGPGKEFTLSQKKQALEINKAANGGVVKSDQSGMGLTKPEKSQRGVTPSPNEWQFDHKQPKACGGSNCSSNLQILSRQENRTKSSN